MDPGTALGVVSLVWDVSKDIYTFYSLWKNRDRDVIALRARLLSILDTCRVVEQTLKNQQCQTADLANAEAALEECRQAAETLKTSLRKVSPEDVLPPGLRSKLKSRGRRLLYPFKKAEIESLSEDVLAARDALHFISNILGLQLEIQTLDELGELDTKLNDRFDDVGAALEQLKTNQALSLASLASELHQLNVTIEHSQSRSIPEIQNAKDAVINRLSQIDVAHDKQARAHELLESLRYPEMDIRRRMISEAQAETYQWVFMETPTLEAESTIYEEVAQGLTSWLRQTIEDAERRILWIRGKAGSGKSTFVKFLRDNEQTSSLLHQWAGSNRLVIVEHYFWVAGSLQEKSILGFLQHLLYQLLNADPTGSVAIIESDFSQTSGTKTPWTINRLWSRIVKVLERSSKCVCFFIDGLDEAWPDKDHTDLVHRLKQLVSSNANIKIILSSRPWSIFESAFREKIFKVTTESVNRRDIINYTMNRLKTVSDDFDFTDAEVNDLVGRPYWLAEQRNTPESLQLAAEIVDKADGVFLWTSLVLDGLCERLQAGESFSSVQAHVNDFPPEVEKYFEQCIYARINSTWASQTAMVLWIMISGNNFNRVGNTEIEYIWLVANSTGGRPGSLLKPGFAYDIPDIPDMTDDVHAVQRIYQDTRQFLLACCKDLVHIPAPDREDPRYLDDLPDVTFSHRTVWDFLHTDRMQLLLKNHLPVTFEDALFMNFLSISALKVGPMGIIRFFERIEDAFRMRTNSYLKGGLVYASNSTKDPKEVPRQILIELEDLALKKFDLGGVWLSSPCMKASFLLAIHGYRATLDKVLEVDKSGSCVVLNREVGGLDLTPLGVTLGYPDADQSQFSPQEPIWDLSTARILLQHGADPGHFYEINSYATGVEEPPGRAFLTDSNGALSNLLLQFEHYKRVYEFGFHSVQFGWFQHVSANCFRFRTQKLRGFSEDSFVDIVRFLIEYGADLYELVPVHEVVGCEGDGKVIFDCVHEFLTTRQIIERRISIAQSSEWQALLDEHCTDEKRDKLRTARKQMVKHWPAVDLSPSDRRLLRMKVPVYGNRLLYEGHSFEDLRRNGVLWKYIDLSAKHRDPPCLTQSPLPGNPFRNPTLDGDSDDSCSSRDTKSSTRRLSLGGDPRAARNLVQNPPQLFRTRSDSCLSRAISFDDPTPDRDNENGSSNGTEPQTRRPLQVLGDDPRDAHDPIQDSPQLSRTNSDLRTPRRRISRRRSFS